MEDIIVDCHMTKGNVHRCFVSVVLIWIMTRLATGLLLFVNSY